MKLPSVLVAVFINAVAVLAPFASQAIEPSAVVKVKEVLKTSTTWDGAPISAVLGIYARETGQGMIFSEADAPPPQPSPPAEPTTGSGEGKRSKPTLKVVK